MRKELKCPFKNKAQRFTTPSGSLWKATLATKEKGACAWNALLNTLIPVIRKEFE